MGDRNPLWVSHTGGVVTIDDARIGISAVWTPGSSNVNARKGLRPGGTTAAASPGLVAQQTVADKTVKVNPYQATIPASRATGSFICTLDAVKNIDLLTAHPAHASLQRNDLIVGQVSDETFDSANGFSTFQVVGTPNASPSDPVVNTTNGAPTNSPDYIVLARVRVTAGATTITSSMIDDLRPPWMVALGGTIPVTTATDRATLTPHEGMQIWRIDRQWTEAYSISAGGWLIEGTAVCASTADRDAIITTPYAGQLAYTTDTNTLWSRQSGTWVPYVLSSTPRGRLGIVDGTADVPIGATETMIDSVSFTHTLGRREKVSFASRFSLNTTGVTFLRMRYKVGGSVAVTDTQFYETIVQGTAGNGHACAFKTLPPAFAALASGTYTVGVSSLPAAGATSGVFNGSASGLEREFLVEDIGT